MPSNKKGVPSANSGVTIGIGVDLANGLHQSDLEGIFPDYEDNPNLLFLYKAIGADGADLIIGQDALNFLSPPNGAEQTITVNGLPDPASVSVSITQSQAEQLTNWAQTATVTTIESAWTAGGGSINSLLSLPSLAQTVLVDVGYNSGAQLNKSAPRFLADMIAAAQTVSTVTPNGAVAAWQTVINELLHWSPPKTVTTTKGTTITTTTPRLTADAGLIAQLAGIAAVPPQAESGTLVASNDTSYNFAVSDATTHTLWIRLEPRLIHSF